MLVCQHIHRHWTKATRSAATSAPRLALPTAFALPPPPAGAGPDALWLHEVGLWEDRIEALEIATGAFPARDWKARPRINLRWEPGDRRADVTLLRPFGNLATRWPRLPWPLASIGEGEVVRIDWNGRFISDSSYTSFVHATLWLTWSAEPAASVFEKAEPRRHIDLRGRIY